MRGKRLVALGLALAAMPATAHAAEQLSVTKRLKDRRAVAAGTRAYSVGFQDGRFYANGWHITGEMGGDLGAAAQARRRHLVRHRRRRGSGRRRSSRAGAATSATRCRRSTAC